MKQSSTRGGKRPGAGRPKGDSRIYSFRCPGTLAERMELLPDRTEFILHSIRRALDHSADMPQNAVSASSVNPITLPLYDTRVVAGFPVPLDSDERSQDINMLSLLCPHPESTYLIRVKGDSMTDAGVQSGDIVIVDKSNRNPMASEIAVCELNGEFTLKHFAMENGQGWLIPANPAYPRIRITQDDDFCVWGTVTYIIHKARD